MPEIQTPQNINNPAQILSTSRPTVVKTPIYIQGLKIISVATLLTSLLGSMYLNFDLDPENKYLSLFGYDNNTQTLYNEVLKAHGTISRTKTKLSKEEKELKTKIETKDYSEHTQQIKDIKSEQITWFDRINKEGVFEMGLFNIPTHLGDYVNKRQLDNILGSDENRIVIENITANRTNINFGFEASSPYKKVFNLTNEFIHLINGLTNLKGVQISSFTRSENEDGYESMSFSVNAQIQKPEDTDAEDLFDLSQSFMKWSEDNANLNTLKSTKKVVVETKSPILRKPLPRN